MSEFISAPTWESNGADLLCPLCTYNLRGLTESRCPECGFTFNWQELIDAEKNRHLYLFEHGKGRNIKSFWKTYWRTCQPRRFWTDLNPAQPVRVVWLMVYWLIASVVMSLSLSGYKISEAVKLARTNLEARSQVSKQSNVLRGFGIYYSQAEIDARWPLPWDISFWKTLFFPPPVLWTGTYDSGNLPSGFGWASIFLIWPFLTLLSLLIFRISMRKAKIRTIHLVRTAIYSCDFGLSFAFVYVAMYAIKPVLSDGLLFVIAAIVCALITTYRLAIAFDKYFRVHRPLETVLASQLISFLIVFVCLVPIADFSRQV